MKVITILDNAVLCPFQMTHDIFEQLAEPTQALTQKIFEPVCPLNAPTDWVNLDDSIGDLGALRAFEMNALLVSLLRKNFLAKLELHIQLGESQFTMDNFYSLLFLCESIDESNNSSSEFPNQDNNSQQILENLNIIFYAHHEQLAKLHHLTRSLTGKKNVHIHYDATSSFIADKKKPHPLTLKHQQLLNAQGFGFGYQLDNSIDGSIAQLGSLINYAWTCLKAGAYQLGCRVLEQVLQQNNIEKKVREHLFVQLQVIRFLSHQHHLVVTESFPEAFDFINEEHTSYLYFIKAFSATLTRHLELAETCFMKAHISLTMPISDEYSIYKLNLFALFLVLKGDLEDAFMLENRLYEHVKNHHINIAAVNHVVLINIARLYKKTKCYDEAAVYYKKAYEQISGGGFTLFDSINNEMDKAILAEARGQSRQALLSWIKVAMYWLSCPNPYALALRPRLVLCQEKVIDTLAPLSREKVNKFLFEKISGLGTVTKLKGDNSTSSVVNFILPNLEKEGEKTAYISNELIIYAYENASNREYRAFTAIEYDLHHMIYSYLKELLGTSNIGQTLAIETNLELLHPQSAEAAAAFALLGQCHCVYFNGTQLDLSPRFSEEVLSQLKIRLSPMIYAVTPIEEGLQLHNKRSFLNTNLTAKDEVNLVNLINNSKQFSLIEMQSNLQNTLLHLVAKKILYVEFQEPIPSLIECC